MITGYNDNNEQPESAYFKTDVTILVYLAESDLYEDTPLFKNATIKLEDSVVTFTDDDAPALITLLDLCYLSILEIDSVVNGIDTMDYLAELKSGLNVKQIDFI